MPSPVQVDEDGRQFYRRSKGAYRMIPSKEIDARGRHKVGLKHVGYGHGNASLIDKDKDGHREAYVKDAKLNLRYPQQVDSPAEGRHMKKGSRYVKPCKHPSIAPKAKAKGKKKK